MRTPEGFEKDDITKFLQSLDTVWFFKPFMKGFGQNGVSDIIGCYRGRLFSIEVKREGILHPTTIQDRRMKEVRAAGGWTVCGPASVVIPAFKAEFGV